MKLLGVSILSASVLLLALPALSADPALSVPPAASIDRQRLERGRERLLEQLREHGLVPRGSASTSPAPSALPAGSARPLPSTLVGLASDLKQKWSALTATRHERRERHRAALARALGPRLGEPAVQQELQLHARRVAELGRVEFLARNARTGPAREQLLARVAKLSAHETERHRRRLSALGVAPAPSAPAARPSGEVSR